jgi:hypothetical protein
MRRITRIRSDIRIRDIPNVKHEHYAVTSGLKFESFELKYYNVNPHLSKEATMNWSRKRNQQRT